MAKTSKNKSAPQDKPWDELPIKPMGDGTPIPLYQAVGVALTAWESLDYRLSMLFGILVNSRKGAAEAAYRSLVSPQAKSGMILAATARIFKSDEPLHQEITTLLNEIGHLSGKRNNIAHGFVSSFTHTKQLQDGSNEVTEYGHYLIPNPSIGKKELSEEEVLETFRKHGFDRGGQFDRKYAYTADQVMHFANHFATYRERLVDLITRLSTECRKRWPPPEPLELQLQQRIAELEAKLKSLSPEHPPQPSQG